MQLNLLHKSQGTIFSKRVQPDENGKVLSVNIVQSEKSGEIAYGGYSRITCISFDEFGFRLLLADHKGSIFLFNFKDNKYQFITNCSQACTCLAFSLKPKPIREIYVGLVDNSFRSFDLGLSQWLSIMRGHTSTIRTISIHDNGEVGITSTVNSAIIWNLLSWTRLRQLNVNQNIGITQVFFQNNFIVSCFRDDSIFMWDYESLDCKLKLPAASEDREPVYRSLACSCDGRLLMAAGKSRFIDIWNLESGTLRQTIELPKPIIGVRKVLFLEPNKIDSDGQETLLAVLGEDRRLRLIQMSTCRLLMEFNTGNPSKDITDPLVLTLTTGLRRADKLAIISASNGGLHLYDLGAIWREANKPELPIRKIWRKPDGKVVNTSDSPLVGATSLHFNENNKEEDNIIALKGTPSSLLDRRKLRGILKEYSCFPSKYRPFIWRGLMQLPGNVSVLTSLLEKGIHPSWDLLPQKYPIKSQKLTRCLQRVLSALAFWSPLFAECDFLPLLAFPFVKVFQNNHLLAFEMVASILMNWCRDWFEYFPNPPINVLCMVENLLAHHDRDLYQHLVDHGVTTEIYAWPLMETVFSEVLTKDEWLALWDNLICRHPGFMLLCVVAYSLCAKSPLMRVTEIEQIESFYQHQNCITTSDIIQRALALDCITPAEIHPSKLLNKFEPLSQGQYPLFQKYPKFIVDFQIRERERIREEEKEYLKQKYEAEELQRRTEINAAQEQSWYRQQELLNRAEERRKLIILEEEEKLKEQKKRLAILIEQLQKKETQLLNQAKTQIRKFQTYKNERQINNINSELSSKQISAFQETEDAIKEAENKIRHLEIEITKKNNESLREQFMENNSESAYGNNNAFDPIRSSKNTFCSDEYQQKVDNIHRDLYNWRLDLNQS